MVFQEQKEAVRKMRRCLWMRTYSQEKTWRSSMKNSTQWHWRTEECEMEARMDWRMHGVQQQGQDVGFLNFRDSRNKAWLYYDITICLWPPILCIAPPMCSSHLWLPVQIDHTGLTIRWPSWHECFTIPTWIPLMLTPTTNWDHFKFCLWLF